ncbi:LacI family DNA-binding transcriptional regulator [Klenkia sp. PcliD-1-E]|uniref:LacI family DNA-binding transcriptional regulator n=1 Tax=Klenkia sp. PcliD-1-E TaxID=2954492 RepID=UPI002096DE03|nr:LacI family DNA-binding transcriptional regulator [Klenkia sp. PcliD-1-E]MCO7220592.1 LacI family transcriptional regulator [Klenkia sp. PcliD-1-E]
MAVTLTSVAQLAGVSVSTASRALTGHPSVQPATRDRVVAAVADLRYRPNRMAAALRTRRTGLVGLVVNNLWNATFGTVAETLQSWGADAGWQVVVCTTGGDAAREAAFLDTALDHGFDGVVVAGSGANHDRVNALLDAGTAVVTTNREVPGARAASVVLDYRSAGRLATEHLLAAGHTRIATVSATDDVTSGREQHAGVVAALAAAGLPLPPELVHRGPFTTDFGRAATTALLDLPDPPTALLVTNHEAAGGVLPVLSARGTAVPRELSVVLTEDEPFYGWWPPRLTAVDNRAAGQARAAARLLHAQLTGAAEPGPTRALVEPVLVARDSVGPPR